MGLRQPTTTPPKLPEFDKLRTQATQRINAQGGQASDALKRKFASLGNLNSGAAIKQEQKMQAELGEQREQAMAGIDVAEAQEGQRRLEVQENRDFAAGESRIGREFASGEAKLGRDFAGQESALSRALQSEQFGKQFGLQNEVFGEQKNQNTFTNKLAGEEHALNVKNTNINTAKALAEAKDPGKIAAMFEQLNGGQQLGTVSQNAAMSRRQQVSGLRPISGGTKDLYGRPV